jgi:hypothetical protein
MKPKGKPRLCRICKQRPPWKYKNCPPGICKRSYHQHVYADRPEARRLRAESAALPVEELPDE